MRQYVDLGPLPSYEIDLTEGEITNPDLVCTVYVGQLRRTLGHEPAGANLVVRKIAFGSLLWSTVECWYESESQDAANYASRCDWQRPEYWDDAARAALKSG